MRCFPVVSPRMKHFSAPREGGAPGTWETHERNQIHLPLPRGQMYSEHSLRGGDSSVELCVRCAGNSHGSAFVCMIFELESSMFSLVILHSCLCKSPQYTGSPR